MISLYSDAVYAWEDYINNGLRYKSRGSFFADFIYFFEEYHSQIYFEVLQGFYEDNFPNLSTFQINIHVKNLEKNLQIDFFNETPTKIQKNYIDFCYKEIENYLFPPWISADLLECENNVIDLTTDTDDEMPDLEDDSDMPPLIEVNHDNPYVNYVQDILNNFIPVGSKDTKDEEVVHPVVQPDEDDTDLYDDLFGSSDEESDDDEC